MKQEFPFDISSVFQAHSEAEMEKLCIQIFQYQYSQISVYKDFVDALNIKPEQVFKLRDIPFMPIEFFKDFQILSGDSHEAVFMSSGTTGMSRSRHFVKDVEVYCRSFREDFRLFYGDIQQYVVLALLPSYIENGDSSLVFMADDLIRESKHVDSGFYLNNYGLIIEKLHELQKKKQKVLLLGVSYALLDLVEQATFNMPEMIVMETGGMKGRRKEMVREELHEQLCTGFGVKSIHSEYGMTELLSQAYSKGNGVFSCPPWMKILIRDVNDPLSYMNSGQSGAVNVIDLANIHSVSFLATQDLGKITGENQFEILGRFDNSDIRGCNLLVV